MKEPKLTVTGPVRLPTRHGEFQMIVYREETTGREHVALVKGRVSEQQDVLVRVHSECMTGDVFGSLRCDCGPQLAFSMREVQAAGAGVILYLRQEGRGIGLIEKMKAYNLQDDGYDTVEANLMLGYGADEREYDVAAAILSYLGVRSVRLLTNNPAKCDGLKAHGVSVESMVPVLAEVQSENEAYLRTKSLKMNHKLKIPNK